MTAYSDVFERKEMKYRLTLSQLDAITPALNAHLVPSGFDDTTVRSLYYDTSSQDLIARSLESPLYKEKLRLRVYGDETSPGMPAFIEIKKKYKGIVYKRRITLPLHAAELFLGGMPYEDAARIASSDATLAASPSATRPDNASIGTPICNASTCAALPRILPQNNMQIVNEIAFFLKRYGILIPSILTSCSRRSLVAPTNANGEDASGLRITIDTCLRAKGAAFSIADTQSMAPLIPSDEAIMEVKSKSALPLWLTSALSGIHAYKQRFSKCGTAYALSVLEHESIGRCNTSAGKRPAESTARQNACIGITCIDRSSTNDTRNVGHDLKKGA